MTDSNDNLSELLSAYLDGELSPAESAELIGRIVGEAHKYKPVPGADMNLQQSVVALVEISRRRNIWRSHQIAL